METKQITKYRSVWMGIAIIWIVLFHSGFKISWKPLAMIKEIGYGGVDIFVFAAGLGGYYSYSRDFSPIRFLKRRIYRLFPIYLPFLLVWLPYQIIVNKYPWTAVIGNCLGVQGFTGTGYEFNWYITFLAIVYLLTPVFVSIVDHTDTIKNFVAHMVFWFILSLAFWSSDGLLIIVVRIPLYLLGVYFGKYCKNYQRLEKKQLCVSIGLFCVGVILLLGCFYKFGGYLWQYGFYWYPFLLITPGMCIIISMVAKKMEEVHAGRLIWLLEKIGEHSFEIYLLHIYFLQIYRSLVSEGLLEDTNLHIFITLFLVIPGTIILNLVSRRIKRVVHI